MKKIFALLIATVMCLSLFTACKDEKKEEKVAATAPEKVNVEYNKDVVLKVDDIEITQAYYNFIYSITYEQMAQYQQSFGDDWLNMEIEEGTGKTVADYIEETTKLQVEQLAASTILAGQYGIKSDKDVKKAVEEQKKMVVENYGGEEGYADFLKSSSTTDEAIDQYLETYEILNRLFEKISQEGEKGYVADAEIEKAFLEDYKDKLRVQHVLISTMADEQTGAPGKSDEEALKLAKEVIAKLDKGEEMDTLISDYNEDPGMSAGQYYTFGTGEMVEEFEKASRELKVGEYTKEPVKSDYGYHIIKKYAIDTTIPEFEDYKLMRKQEKTTEVIQEESEKLTFKWNDKIVKEAVKKLKAEKQKAK